MLQPDNYPSELEGCPCCLARKGKGTYYRVASSREASEDATTRHLLDASSGIIRRYFDFVNCVAYIGKQINYIMQHQ